MSKGEFEYVVQLDGNGNVVSAGGGTSATDDAAFTAATSSYVPVGGFVTADAVDAGDGGAFAMLANRQQKVTIYDSAGAEVSVGSGTQYAVDAALGAAPTGTLAIAIRDDALSALTPIEGDAIGLRVDANGALWVIPSGTTAVSNAGTFAVQAEGNIASGSADSGNPVKIGGRNNTIQPTLTDGQRGDAQLDTRGNLQVTLFQNDTSSVMSAGNGDGSGGAVLLGSGAFLFNGATWDRTRGDITNGLDVDVTRLPALVAGTANIGDVDVASIAAGDNNIGNVDIVTMPNVTLAAGTNTNEVVGDAAHAAAIAGNPVRIGARGLSADYTAVATGQTADLITTLLGKQVVLPFALPAETWTYAAASGGIVNTTAVTVKAAGAAGVRNYVTQVQVINGHATVSTEVMIRDGAAGTVLWRGWAQAAGGGVAATFTPPLRGTAATLLEVVNVTTGAATYFNLQGYQAGE